MKDRTEEIILDSIDPCLKIACLIRKSNRARRINLRIRSKEKVVLTLPRWTSLREGYSFLNQQKKWLDKNVRKFPSICSLVQYFSNGGRVWLSDNFHLLTCLKMSDHKKGDWQPAWDGLFWRFMHVNRDFFLKNPRLGMLVRTFDKMSDEKQQNHLQNAEDFLETLDK